MKNTLRLAFTMLRRDWRAGELSVLMAALLLAVSSVGTVGFFTDRVKQALTGQANVLLGADLLLSGDRPLPDEFAAEARALGRHARIDHGRSRRPRRESGRPPPSRRRRQAVSRALWDALQAARARTAWPPLHL